MENKLILDSFLNPIHLSSSSSSSSSEESSFSEDEFKFRERHARVENYFENTVPLYSDADYKSNFRLSRSSVNRLCDMIDLGKSYCGGWPEIGKAKAVHITLHYLANTNTFREVADKFNVTRSACHHTVSTVIEILKNMAKDYIKLPERHDFISISNAFEVDGGFSHTLGAIDGTHIQINRPKENQEDYYNRKGYHSIILQGIVDNNKRFIDIYVGEPGSLHDARVLKKSPIFSYLQEQNKLEPYYFLADTAYPASISWLVPPFKDNGNLSNNQKKFNVRLSRKRIVVEHAFGLLKGRFRRLTSFSNKDITFIVNAVVAAVVLHNLCISWDDLHNIEDLEDTNTDNERQQLDEEDTLRENQGLTRRDELFRNCYI